MIPMTVTLPVGSLCPFRWLHDVCQRYSGQAKGPYRLRGLQLQLAIRIHSDRVVYNQRHLVLSLRGPMQRWNRGPNRSRYH